MFNNIILNYIIALLSSFILSIYLTVWVRQLATKLHILDYPDSVRKLHEKPMPLLGGLAIFLGLFIVLIFFILLTDMVWLQDYIKPQYIIGIFISSFILMLGGFLDDKYHLKPNKQLIFPVLAVFVIIFSGIGINFITNPLGGVFRLDTYKLEILKLDNISYYLVPMADLFVLLWLLAMMYITKLLDGVDGLVSGLGAIGGLVLFFLSIFPPVSQPGTALIALIFSGACLGFCVFNFYPAKIFLGEGGSLFIGFILGVLSIIAGGKIATTLLIVGLPFIDTILVIGRRLFIEHKSITQADRKHFHFKLLDMGLNQRQAVMIFLSLSALFGFSALFLQTRGKLISFISFAIIIIIVITRMHRTNFKV